MRRRVGRIGAACALSALVLAGVVAPAAADPPSADEVAEAEAGIVTTTAAVAGLEVRLAQARAEAQTAEVAAAVAAERYNAAVVALDEAKEAVADAQARAAEARGRLADATDELGRVAMAAYRTGGGLAPLEAILSADGIEDIAARDQIIDRLGQRAVAALQDVEATRVVVDVLERHARQAVRDRAAATAEVAESAQAAEAAASAARSRVGDAEGERTSLLAQLAAYRSTTLAAERARQEALDAERRQRQEESARAAALRVSAPASPVAPPAAAGAARSTTSPPAATARPAAPAVSQPAPPPPPASSSGPQQAALAWALSQVGKPYIWGSAGPNGYDCSGLTMSAYRSVGISLPRTTQAQYSQTTHVPIGQMRPGDLIFYSSNGAASGIYHVAMYAGDGRRVHAPSPGKNVEHVPMYWTNVLPYVGRP